jgi:ribose-phosphate pyrophosphokinase
MKLIAGASNLELAQEIAKILKINLVDAKLQRFSDNETFVEISESVRGDDIFVIQPTSAPANDHIMELLILLDALKRASAKRITAVIPYYGYARQDRKPYSRTPITAKLVADILTSAGANRVLTMDLHSGQIQGFFDIPVDNLFSTPVFKDLIEKKFTDKQFLVVSPDVGGLIRARALAKRLNAELAIVDKRREKPGSSEVMNIIGNVDKKDCIIVDDIVDSAGTLCNAAKALMENGATSVRAFITHGVLSASAVEKIESSDLSELYITNTIFNATKLAKSSKIKILSIAPLFAEAINRIATEQSVSNLFE